MNANQTFTGRPGLLRCRAVFVRSRRTLSTDSLIATIDWPRARDKTWTLIIERVDLFAPGSGRAAADE
jgi:hypothetical protein